MPGAMPGVAAARVRRLAARSRTAQRLRCHRAAAGGVHVEELAPDMGQASQFSGAVGEQRLVVHVVVHHQVAAPAVQEGARMGAGAAGLVVEHDDGRADVVHAGAVRRQVSDTSWVGICFPEIPVDLDQD